MGPMWMAKAPERLNLRDFFISIFPLKILIPYGQSGSHNRFIYETITKEVSTINNSSADSVQKSYQKYSDMVFRIAVLYMKNEQDAYDIIQEVFLKLLKRNRQFESEEHEKAWILRVAANCCKDQLKSHWKKNRVSWNEYETGSIVTAGNFYPPGNGSSEIKDEILSAVLNLPNLYKDVVFLYYYEEYSAEEIAKMLHKNASTIRSRLQKARELLKKSLKEDWL